MWIKKGNIFNRRQAQLPVVDEYTHHYRIYYSHRINGRSLPLYVDVDKKDPSRILYDHTEPILSLGAPGSFDWAGVMPTDIVTLNGIKYMYYIGWSCRQDVPYHNSLGLAISEDNGKSWKKFSKGPVLGTSYKEPGYIGTAEVLIENGVWRMWYLSCLDWIDHEGKMEPTYDIKYAESINAVDWEPKGITCIHLSSNEGGISAARVIKTNDGYKMWYSVRNKINYRVDPENTYKIKEAYSNDGIIWNRDKNLISLDISKELWENKMVCYPEVLKTDIGLIMFYNGNEFGKTGIGYAIR